MGINTGTYACGDVSDSGAHQTDWRLPNIKEFQSLFNYNYLGPVLSNTVGDSQWTDGDPFQNLNMNGYWSSTTSAVQTDKAHIAGFYFGQCGIISKTTVLYRVMGVRGGLIN